MIRIRSYAADDLAQLVPLFRGFFNLHRQLLGCPQALSEAEAAEIAEQSLNQAQSWTVVAEDEQSGEVLGFARWEAREGAFFGRELFVRPDYRQRGIGASLWQEVERRVVEAGADALFVSIIPHNKDVLAFAYGRGYDTLNTVELRRELKGERPRRGQVQVFGLEWRTL